MTYHGVLAPAARLRPAIVPLPPEKAPVCPHQDRDAWPTQTVKPKLPRRGRRRYYTWAELIQRVFRTDVLVCPGCQGLRKIVAQITDPFAVRRILAHLGLSTTPLAITPARSPPGLVDDYAP